MPESCALYSTRRAQYSLDEIRAWAGSGTLDVEAAANGDWQSVTIQWPECRMTLHRMAAEELAPHLDGFRGYLQHCAQRMTPAVYALIQRTYLMHHCIGTGCEPAITQNARDFLRQAARVGHGLLFRENRVLSPEFQSLVGPGYIAEDAPLDYWPDSVARRKRTVELLGARGLQVSAGLPPVPGDAEVIVRRPEEVGRRALALYAVASRGAPGGIRRKKAWSLLAGNESALSPKERAFLEELFLRKKARIQSAWRFESLWALLWALGVVGELGWPGGVVAVAEVEAVVHRLGTAALPQAGKLRPATELLDALDLVYCCHWITTDARVKGVAAPSLLDPGVVFERHYALNWLTCFQNKEWDEVSTDT